VKERAVLCLLFEFPFGRYHATPWGHHVNEGLVEWPPSPWRIIRALLATGYTRLGWHEVPSEARALVDALVGTLPTYRLPPATTGHSRHYMPIKGWKRGVQNTSLVIDAFVRPHGALGVIWDSEIDARQRELLAGLLDRLGYLGRAESRVKARLVPPDALPAGWDVSPHRQNLDDEPVRLLAPLPRTQYEAWRRDHSDAPPDLLAALHIDTATLELGSWNAPPGSREVVYWRPAGALSLSQSPSPVDDCGGVVFADTALFALATDRKRDVLPLMERALPTMALFRRALLSKVGDQELGACPELTGKDEQGRPLQEGHRHAHFIPLCLDARNPERIDHVLVYAPVGFGPAAQGALRRLRKTWAKGIDDIAVTLIGIGDLSSFRTVGGVQLPELARSEKWISRTPFVPPRFLKARGKDSLDGQVRSELRRRGLPDLVGASVVALPRDEDKASARAPRFRHFVRTIRNSRAPDAPPGVFHLTLHFEREVEGPLCLGWGCHFGLGLFVASGTSARGASHD
jgi:CRISPR-associated protein Csb2